MSKTARWAAYAVGCGAAALIVGALILAALWRERIEPETLNWPAADDRGNSATVSATWFGVSTLLFDDGETQILIDGAFTRLAPLDVLLRRSVRSDIGTVNLMLDRFRMDRVAAIVPVNSHFDHAIDVGHIANRTGAIVLGSESTANIARGANVPVDQYQILKDLESRHFGAFTITVMADPGPAVGPGGDAWFTGTITEPLSQPARTSAWRAGRPTTVIVEHPSGVSVVKGSASFVEDGFAERTADVVFLSIAGLESRGRTYTESYWENVVTATKAPRVIATHFDDVTQPLGDVRLLPPLVDAVSTAAGWVDELAATSDVVVERPRFGAPIPLY